MAKKVHNPIALKIRQIRDSGKLTLEAICVAADIKYPTLMNIFDRARVSKLTIKSLLYKGIISHSDVEEYESWYQQNKTSKREKQHRRSGKIGPEAG